MSPDSFDSLSQALTGNMRDWHPPVFALVWRGLLGVSGLVGSMGIFIVLIEWCGLLLFARYVYHFSKSRLASIIPLMMGISPTMLGISGVVWKDVLMANILLIGVATAFSIKSSQGRRKLAFLGLSLLSYIMAFLLRYNVAPALIPLVIFSFWSYGGYFSKKSVTIGATLAVFALMPLLMFAISHAARVERTHPEAAIMVDDIIHVDYSLGNSRLENMLSSVQSNCINMKIVVNGFIACASEDQKVALTHQEYSSLQSLWLKVVISHPFSYIAYRMHAFEFLLFAPSANAYIWQDGIDNNPLGLQVKSHETQQILKMYVIDFGYRHFSFAFEGWFWMLVALLTVFIARKSRYKIVVSTLSLSGLLYILSYAPITVAADFRYIYWSTICVSMSCIILFFEWRLKRLRAESSIK